MEFKSNVPKVAQIKDIAVKRYGPCVSRLGVSFMHGCTFRRASTFKFQATERAKRESSTYRKRVSRADKAENMKTLAPSRTYRYRYTEF